MVQNCKVTNSPRSRRKEKKLHANRLRMTNNHPEEKAPPIKAAVTAMNLQAPNSHIICFALKPDKKNTNYSYMTGPQAMMRFSQGDPQNLTQSVLLRYL